MIENSVTSLVAGTIRSYVERIGSGFGIGARTIGDCIVVDFNPGREPSSVFPAVVERIALEMGRVFRERLHLPDGSEQIEVQSTLPITEASREFHRKHFNSNQ